MAPRPKFAGWLLALCLSASLAASSLAQSANSTDRPPQKPTRAPATKQANAPVKQPSNAPHRDQTPVSHDDRPPVRAGNSNSATRDAGNTVMNPNRPPANRQDPNRPSSSQYSGGEQNTYNNYRNNLSPEERQRVLQNQQRFRQLSPQQQQDLRDRQRVWQQMTQQQRDHIKYQVLPGWRDLPPQRKRAIEQRLGVLQNMPEFARNQHLNDPNFTRGMSREDRATLRDLSHLHVGGAPDPPTNNPY